MIPNSAMDGSLFFGWVSAWGVTYLIHSTLLLGAVWFLTRTRRLSPGWQDTLWKVALIGGLVTATWQTTAPENTLLGSRINLGIVGVETTTEQSPRSFPANNPLPVFSDNTFESLPPVSPPSSRGYLVQLAKRVRTAAAHGWPQLLLGGWVLGAALCLARLGTMRARLGRLIEDRRPISHGHLHTVLQKLCLAAGWKHGIRLTASSRLGGPIALVRSEICIPERVLTDLGAEQQENVLAHELAHVVRFDPAWRWISAVMECVFFFQPLNRVARKGLEESAEFLCDDWAVQRTGQSLTLARCLVDVAEWVRPNAPVVHAASMADNRSPLVRRVERLLSGVTRRETPQQWRLLPAFALLCAVVVVSPVVTAEKESIPEMAQTSPTPEDLALWVVDSGSNEDAGNVFFYRTPRADGPRDLFFLDEIQSDTEAKAPEVPVSSEDIEVRIEQVSPKPRQKEDSGRKSARKHIKIHDRRVHRVSGNRVRSIHLKKEAQHIRRSMDPVIVQVKRNLPVVVDLGDLENLAKHLELVPRVNINEMRRHLEQIQAIQLDLDSTVRFEIQPGAQTWHWQFMEGEATVEPPQLNEREVLRAYQKALKDLRTRTRNLHRTYRVHVI